MLPPVKRASYHPNGQPWGPGPHPLASLMAVSCGAQKARLLLAAAQEVNVWCGTQPWAPPTPVPLMAVRRGTCDARMV